MDTFLHIDLLVFEGFYVGVDPSILSTTQHIGVHLRIFDSGIRTDLINYLTTITNGCVDGHGCVYKTSMIIEGEVVNSHSKMYSQEQVNGLLRIVDGREGWEIANVDKLHLLKVEGESLRVMLSKRSDSIWAPTNETIQPTGCCSCFIF